MPQLDMMDVKNLSYDFNNNLVPEILKYSGCCREQ